MFVMDCLSVNNRGNLEIGGCDCVILAREFGTPLYVLDEGQIRKNCREFNEALNKYYESNGLVLYASKALCTMALCRIAESEGLGLDVVSGGEMYTALKAGFPPEKIYFHGNNKTRDELKMAVQNGIGRIVADNFEEVCLLNDIAAGCNRNVEVLIRIKPGIDAHVHEFVKTGDRDSKFGFSLEEGQALSAALEIFGMKNLRLAGIHCHIGSQIFGPEPFDLAINVMMGFLNEVRRTTGDELRELNIGGGFGIKYVREDDPMDFEGYIRAISSSIIERSRYYGFKPPRLLIEPGRAIVGNAGITLYTAGSVKNIPGITKYVSVDGGMTDNPRYALYGARYEAVAAGRAAEPKSEKVTIAGKCCESGDVIVRDVMLQDVKAGDIVAIQSTGAYNYSMASNYNRIPRPAVVLANEGKPKVIVMRETYEDMVSKDVIPEDI